MDILNNEPIINIDELDYQIKWLKYIPDFWNMKEVYTKLGGNLKVKECERLLEVKKDKSIAKKLLKIQKSLSNEQLINGIKYASIEKSMYNDYHKIVDSLDLNRIILSKISDVELKEISSIIKEYDGYNESQSINRINNIENELIKEYTLKLFNDKRFEYMVNKFMNNNTSTKDKEFKL